MSLYSFDMNVSRNISCSQVVRSLPFSRLSSSVLFNQNQRKMKRSSYLNVGELQNINSESADSVMNITDDRQRLIKERFFFLRRKNCAGSTTVGAASTSGSFCRLRLVHVEPSCDLARFFVVLHRTFGELLREPATHDGRVLQHHVVAVRIGVTAGASRVAPVDTAAASANLFARARSAEQSSPRPGARPLCMKA